jgi:transposase
MFKSGVARQLQTTYKSVRLWCKAYRESGPESLSPKPAPGRPCRLSPHEKEDLVAQLLKGASAHGFETDLWTLPRIRKLIRRLYGVRYHPGHMGNLMKRLGFSHQKPQGRPVERNEEAIRHWVQHGWPRIKKSPEKARTPRFH